MLPNFIIIGACKAGTTSLHDYLDQHPDVYMSPKKETNFFALVDGDPRYYEPVDQFRKSRRQPIKTLEAYQTLFGRVRGERAIGEASPWYLLEERVPERIQRYIPQAKLIAILRNPVEQAYSNFQQKLRQDVEPQADFLKAIRATEQRMRENWHPFLCYKHLGRYYTQLSRYYACFASQQIRVYLYEDLQADNIRLCQDIFRFLEIDDTFIPNITIRHNTSGIPSKGWQKFMIRTIPFRRRVGRILTPRTKRYLHAKWQGLTLRKAPPIPSEARKELLQNYRGEIQQLQDLIRRDLSHWLK